MASPDDTPDESTRDARVEPLFAALGNEKRTGSGRGGLVWKLFWAGLVFVGLVVLVLKQSF